MNAREKRRARREADRTPPPTLDDVGEVETKETAETFERVPWVTHPCPKCGMTELRRLAGTDVYLCYLCDR